MQNKPDAKIIVFFIILAIAELYMIGAFGSVEGSHGHIARDFRDKSRILVLIAAIAGLFVLPTTDKNNLPLPKLPKALFHTLVILLSWGVLVIVNAKSDQELGVYIWQAMDSIPWEAGPGTLTYTTSLGFVFELAIIITFIFMVAKSTQTTAWKGILGSLGLFGALVTIVGLGHKMLGMEHVYGLEVIGGRPVIDLPEFYFAPFIYNANAASFLNLTFAINVGLAFYYHRSNPSSILIYLWGSCAGLCVIGVISAASKAGVIILVAQMGLFAIAEGPYILKSLRKRKRRSSLSLEKKIALGVVGAVFLAFAVGSASTVIKRFDHLLAERQTAKGSATMEGRALMRELTWDLITDNEKVGWVGAGPGSFAHFMPFVISTEEHTESINEHWHHAHCDPLQTIVEWGYLGAACWFFIGIGALARALYLGITLKEGSSNSHIFRALSIGIIGISVHSVYDFPFSIFSIHVTVIACLTIMWTLKNREHKHQKTTTNSF